MTDTVVVTFGKYNVITQGHLKVFEKIDQIAKSERADLRIYLSSSEKPLPYKEKVYWAKKSFPKLAKSIQNNSKIRNMFDIMVECYKDGYKNVVMVVGGDRIGEFENLIPKYNGKQAKHGYYEFDDIRVVSAGERNSKASDVSGLSSSKLRQAVKDGDKGLFMSSVSPYLSDKDKERYYEVVSNSLSESWRPRFRDLITESTASLMDFILSKPILILTPTSVARIEDGMTGIKGWHVTDLPGLKGLMKIQNKRKSVSVTTNPNATVLHGLNTSGGVAVYVKGNKLFDSNIDIFSQRSKEGLKVIYYDMDAIPGVLADILKEVWQETWIYGLRELQDSIDFDGTDAGKLIEEIIKALQQGADPGNRVNTMALNFQLRSLIRPDKLGGGTGPVSYNTPELKKIMGQLMRKIVKKYIDTMESKIKRNKKAIADAMLDVVVQPGETADWNEKIISHVDIMYVVGIEEVLEKTPGNVDQLKKLQGVKVSFVDTVDEFLDTYSGTFNESAPLYEESKPITKKDLDQIEKYADKLFAKIDVDVEFTRHFLDRANDKRNKKQISAAELIRLFRETYKKYGKIISNMPAEAQAVIKDMVTDINVPFVLNVNKKGEIELVNKTVMRKKGFMTSNPVLSVEQKEWRKTMEKAVSHIQQSKEE